MQIGVIISYMQIRIIISYPPQTFLPTIQANVLLDVLNIFLHHTSLNIVDLMILDEIVWIIILYWSCWLRYYVIPVIRRHKAWWDESRECLKPLKFPEVEDQSIDTLETDIDNFSGTLISARKTVEINRPNEALKHFPDLDDIIAEKHQIRKRWQRYKQREDMVELNRLTNLIHKAI